MFHFSPIFFFDMYLFCGTCLPLAHMAVRGPLWKLVPLPPCGSQGWISGEQAWKQLPLPAKPPLQPQVLSFLRRSQIHRVGRAYRKFQSHSEDSKSGQTSTLCCLSSCQISPAEHLKAVSSRGKSHHNTWAECNTGRNQGTLLLTGSGTSCPLCLDHSPFLHFQG